MTLKVVLPRGDQKRRKGNAREIAEGKKILRANYSLEKSNGWLLCERSRSVFSFNEVQTHFSSFLPSPHLFKER